MNDMGSMWDDAADEITDAQQTLALAQIAAAVEPLALFTSQANSDQEFTERLAMVSVSRIVDAYAAPGTTQHQSFMTVAQSSLYGEYQAAAEHRRKQAHAASLVAAQAQVLSGLDKVADEMDDENHQCEDDGDGHCKFCGQDIPAEEKTASADQRSRTAGARPRVVIGWTHSRILRAAMRKRAANSTCRACGDKINRDANGIWADSDGHTSCPKQAPVHNQPGQAPKMQTGHQPNSRGMWGSKSATVDLKPGDKIRALRNQDDEVRPYGDGSDTTQGFWAGGESYMGDDLIVTEVKPDGTVWCYNPKNSHGNENFLFPGNWEKVGTLKTADRGQPLDRLYSDPQSVSDAELQEIIDATTWGDPSDVYGEDAMIEQARREASRRTAWYDETGENPMVCSTCGQIGHTPDVHKFDDPDRNQPYPQRGPQASLHTAAPGDAYAECQTCNESIYQRSGGGAWFHVIGGGMHTASPKPGTERVPSQQIGASRHTADRDFSMHPETYEKYLMDPNAPVRDADDEDEDRRLSDEDHADMLAHTAAEICPTCKKNPLPGDGSLWCDSCVEQHGDGYDDDEDFTASLKTATRYCPTHKVYVGDGNAAQHTDCKVETRKAKESGATTRGWDSAGEEDISAAGQAWAREHAGEYVRIDFDLGDQDWGRFVIVGGNVEWQSDRNDYTHPIDFDEVDGIVRVAERDTEGEGLFDRAPYNTTAGFFSPKSDQPASFAADPWGGKGVSPDADATADHDGQRDSDKRHDDYWKAHPDEYERHMQQNAALSNWLNATAAVVDAPELADARSDNPNKDAEPYVDNDGAPKTTRPRGNTGDNQDQAKPTADFAKQQQQNKQDAYSKPTASQKAAARAATARKVARIQQIRAEIVRDNPSLPKNAVEALVATVNERYAQNGS